MNTIIGNLGKSQKFIDLMKNIENKKSPIAISGLVDVGEVSLLAGIIEYSKTPIMLITYNEIQAQKIVDDIKYFTDKVCYLPKKDVLTYDYVAESKDLLYERISVLNKIYEEKNIIIVTTIEAIGQKMITKQNLYKNVLNYKIGERCNIDQLKQRLVDLGYIRCELIDGRGQFSIRGGIIDISVTDTQGVRIELWGDEIDSIRHFSIISQRSTDAIEKIRIYPANEYILENSIEDICKKIEANVYEGKRQENLEEDIEEIKNGNYISKIDKYFNSFYENQETILDYLDKKYILCIDEIAKIRARSKNLKQNIENIVKSLIEKE